MNLSWEIARRYLFGKKSTNAINWITRVVILCLSIGTATMILLLSVFNGFESLLSGLLNAYNPDLKIETIKGLYLNLDDDKLLKIKEIPGIVNISRTIQEVALFDYDGNQEAGIIKGVDTLYSKVTAIDSTLVRGEYVLEDNNLNYGVMGIGIFNKLLVNPGDALTPISVFMPKRNKRGPLDKDYKSLSLYPKAVFSVGNDDDGQMIITNYSFVNALLDQQDMTSFLEIDLDDKADEQVIRQQITVILGNNISIKNRYEQDEAYLRVMNIEKWLAFLLVSFTILILSFNLVGALWMIVIDKKKDLSILKSMGMPSQKVTGIFIRLGTLIGLLGIILGIFIALIFYILQKKYGLIAVPPGFMIDSYPIELRWSDILLTAFTTLIISILSSILPSLRAKNISAYVRHE